LVGQGLLAQAKPRARAQKVGDAGGEKEAIIISMTRSNNNGQVCVWI